MDFDDMFEFGEGAFHTDDENRREMEGMDEHPTDQLLEELEEEEN